MESTSYFRRFIDPGPTIFLKLRAKTTVSLDRKFTKNRIWLNGREELFNSRLVRVLTEVRRRSRKRRHDDSGDDSVDNAGCVHICSENNFPTAAGLASSAAGYACIAFGLAKIFGLKGNISDLARLGSGSASRSTCGGFVEWLPGSLSDGTDCLSHQIAPDNHWPDLAVLILVVRDRAKGVASSDGMRLSVETSALLKYRVASIVPERMEDMKTAIRDRDFSRFAEITMKDSNQLHAICQDSFPPIFYLNETSNHIIAFVHAFNKLCNETRVAYTFDAGPNACLFLLEEHVSRVVSLLAYLYREEECVDFVRGDPTRVSSCHSEDTSALEKAGIYRKMGAVKYVISTKVGPGPMVIDDPDQRLLDGDGLPINTKKTPPVTE